MKIRFNSIMSVIWTVVAIIAGFYAIVNGVGNGSEAGDADWHYILASFGAPGLFAIVFAFCNSIEDIVKLKSSTVSAVKEISQKK